MAAVVGTVAARSVTTERYEPDNRTRPVEWAQRFAQNVTSGVNCQSHRQSEGQVRTESNAPSAAIELGHETLH